MATARDVAEAILDRKGRLDTFRLQKLTFYAHAVHLARTQRPLFHAPIQAWTNGPCIVPLFHEHKGRQSVTTVGGDASMLWADEIRSIEAALTYYGDHDTQWLINQTHLEDPWRDARDGTPAGAPSSAPITDEAILAYYGPILDDPDDDLEVHADDPGLTAAEVLARYAHLN